MGIISFDGLCLFTVNRETRRWVKDGESIESGTHQSLIDLQGEYFKLYNIQAQAFTTAKTGTPSEEESVKGV